MMMAGTKLSRRGRVFPLSVLGVTPQWPTTSRSMSAHRGQDKRDVITTLFISVHCMMYVTCMCTHYGMCILQMSSTSQPHHRPPLSMPISYSALTQQQHVSCPCCTETLEVHVALTPAAPRDHQSQSTQTLPWSGEDRDTQTGSRTVDQGTQTETAIVAQRGARACSMSMQGQTVVRDSRLGDAASRQGTHAATGQSSSSGAWWAWQGTAWWSSWTASSTRSRSDAPPVLLFTDRGTALFGREW